MSSTTTPSSNFRSIFNAALSDYAKQTGIDLATYPFAQTVRNCQSADAILVLLQDRAKQFQAYREGNRKLINSLKPVVRVLHLVSGILGEAAATVPFQPTKAILAGVDVLLTAAIGVSTSYDALVDLFECAGNFLDRLRIYTEIPFSNSMTGIIIKIMVEVLSVLSLATKQIKQGRLKKFAKKLLGESEIEDVLHRLDRLTVDEARMTGTETLQVVHGLVTNMKLIMDDGRSSMDDIRQALVTMQEMTSEMNKMKRDQLQKDIRSWLCPPDPSENHNIARGAHQNGTSEWFTHGSTYEEWNTSGSLLLIHGKPGSGKSILCSTIIHEIKMKCDRGLALMGYYYFDFKDITKQGIRGLLTSILAQLCAKSDSCYQILSDLYSENNVGSQQPDNRALTECLKKTLRLPQQPTKYIIVDAIDECPNTSGIPTAREEVLDLLEELVGLNLPDLRICVISRPEIDIQAVLDPLKSLHVSLHNEIGQKQDILDYISAFVHSDRRMRRWRSEDKQLVIDVLSAKADGIQLETLRRCFPTVIRRALDELPETLDETYKRTLLGIEKEKREFAHRLLQCLTAAVRPLQIDELAEVLAIRFDSGQLPRYHGDWRSEDNREAVLSACSSLIAVVDVDGSPVVQFSHFSVKEYLTSERLANSTEDLSRFHVLPGSAHTILAQASLSVLLHLGDRVDKNRIKNIPFSQYAAQHWVDHARFENVLPSLRDAMERLFDIDEPSFATWIWIYDIDYPFRRHMFEDHPTRPEAVPLYYAALCGFRGLVERLIVIHPEDVDAIGGNNGSVVNAALVKGHLEIVLLLLGRGANVDTWDALGYAPLHRAIERGRRDHVELLLGHRADINLKRINHETPLFQATLQGEVEIARLLLRHDAVVDPPDKDGSTPLFVASQYGRLDMVQLLIEYGAAVNYADNGGWTPLKAASRYGHLDIVRLLIQGGAAVDSPDDRGSTPLMSASRYGHLDIVRFLIQSGAAVDFQDNQGRIPLMPASLSGHLDVVHFLIQSGAAVDLQNNQGRTPLMSASRHAHLDIARLLIQSGAVVDISDYSGQSALMTASAEGHVGIVRLLIQTNAAVDSRDHEGWTALMFASQNGHLDAVRLLIQSGATVDSPDDTGWTPSMFASQYGYLDVLQFLIQSGATVDLHDRNGQTPLAVASRCGQVDIVRELLDHGAPVNVQNTHLMTPLHTASANGHLSIVQLLTERNAGVDKRNEDQQIPLHWATARGQLEIMRLLVKCGSSINSQDSKGLTPLHMAACNGYLAIVKLLIELGADVNIRDRRNNTPLETASVKGCHEVTRYLAERMGILDPLDGMDVSPLDETPQNSALSSLGGVAHRNASGHIVRPSLLSASIEGNLDVVRSLLDDGADVNERNAIHQTPLHAASLNEKLEVAELLIKYGADADCRDKFGKSPLHFASRNGDLKGAQLLLDHGADVNAKHQDLSTPLHFASFNGRVGVAELLLERGADVHARDIDGRTPAAVAFRGGVQEMQEMVQLLSRCDHDSGRSLKRKIDSQLGQSKKARSE